MDPLERIKKQVTDNPIILYMKGTPDFPQCGFSARTVQALKACGVEFAFVNIFEDQEVYKALPKFANWPTFVGSSRVDLQACKLEYSIVSPK